MLRFRQIRSLLNDRTVVLPRLAVRHLQEHEERQDAGRLALG